MGGQKGVVDFYSYLSKHNKIHLAVTKDNEKAKGESFAFFPILFNHWMGLLNLFRIHLLIHIIRKHKVDVIIIEHSYYGWLGLVLKYFTGKPFVIHSHNIEAERFKLAGRKWWKLYGYYERWAHRKADHIFYKCFEDARYFIDRIGLRHPTHTIIPYGTHLTHIPSEKEKKEARNLLEQTHQISDHTILFLFNGTLDYAPNVNAINIICQTIIPALRQQNFLFKIIICGNRISPSLNQSINSVPEIIFTGFVENIDMYFKGCNAFIQPSAMATGIKTKLVEALANDLLVISTEAGIRGISKHLLEEMILIANNEIDFVNSMRAISINAANHTPAAFFEVFNWPNIAHKAYLSLQQL